MEKLQKKKIAARTREILDNAGCYNEAKGVPHLLARLIATQEEMLLQLGEINTVAGEIKTGVSSIVRRLNLC